jgi:hypothetical protein
MWYESVARWHRPTGLWADKHKKLSERWGDEVVEIMTHLATLQRSDTGNRLARVARLGNKELLREE